MKKTITALLLTYCAMTLMAQDQLYRKGLYDMQHYGYHLSLQDDTDMIQGIAKITFDVLQDVDHVSLDLISLSDSTGMTVSAVTLDDAALRYTHTGDDLNIYGDWNAGEQYTVAIVYSGVPADGLIISRSKHGHRTFFGDNWPNRARHWIPAVDHPSDKAMVDFYIEAPLPYEIIANGQKVEETYLRPDRKLTRYSCPNPMPTKVIVIGAAEFATELAGVVEGVPVTTWVYTDDREDGFREYEPAVEILQYFIDKIDEYPNTKLANVQSKTRYGGMENAGNIFYAERTVNGKMDDYGLIAHEIAHQWFGNSASELDWHHVWLSEGFATYLADVYIEDHYGRDSLISVLQRQRDNVIRYYQRAPAPTIDTTITEYVRVLTLNPYQKGAWTLHMMREIVGDYAFWRGIKRYYRTYKYSNALSEDLQRIMEEASGMDLSQFFYQWLYVKGFPVVEKSAKQMGDQFELEIQQTQEHYTFDFPIEIAYIDHDGRLIKRDIHVKDRSTKVVLNGRGDTVVLDPDTELLFVEN